VSLHSNGSKSESGWSEACIIPTKTVRDPNFNIVTATVEQFFPMDSDKLNKDDIGERIRERELVQIAR
jgi:hypothetical protein